MARHFLVNVGALSGSRMLIVLSQILVLPIVARHLDIAEFGDVALAMTIVLFTQLLSDAGITRSLIRREQYSLQEWSGVFWLLILIGLGLTGFLNAIAPLWSWAFDRPTLGSLVAGLSIIPFLLALSAVPTAKMERANRFPMIAAIRTAAAVAGFITAVVMATNGAGAWSLVGQQIAIAVVQCGGAIILSGFRPLSPGIRVPLGDHLVFARNSLGVSFLFTAERQVPMMMVGYVLGATPLGLYSMSQRILNLPKMGLAGPVAQVAFVRMSAAQREAGSVADIYVASIQLLALAVFPPMAVLAGVGETAFSLFLSEAWRPVAMIFALAVPGVALEASTSSAGVLFQAVNRTEIRLRMVFERTLLRLALVAIALPFGVHAVAAAISLTALCYLPRLWVHVGRAVTFDKKAAFNALAGPICASAVLWAACRWVQLESAGWATLGWAGLLLATVWVLAGLLMQSRIRSALSAFAPRTL